MSVKSAKAYVDRLLTDAEFSRSIRNAADARSAEKLLKSAGFVFTRADLDRVVSDVPQHQVRNLG